MLTALLLSLLQSAPAPAADQHLIDAARSASSAFQDRNAAIRAGYRRLGPDIPEMGEHWINPIMIVESRFDPARPPMLTYATIKGKPTLTGVGYALALRAGETAPPTGVSGDWHDHSATVMAELATGDHDGHAPGARVVVLHAWVWLDNPGGVFADANWALPYVRLGRDPPANIDPHAARAVALLHGGVSYYAAVLRSMTGLDFTSELQTAADRAAQDAQHAAIWQDVVQRILEQLPAGMQARVERALM